MGRLLLLGCALSLVANVAHAETYTVGPSGTYRQLDELPTLAPGDIVEVEGGADYDSIWFQDDGAAGDPIIVRGVRSSGGARPVLRGGTNTIELSGDHYVVEGFEVTGGSSRCVFHHAHDIVIRDVVIHDCPSHGLLGADTDSGSLTLEYSEVYATGDGTQRHQIYMSTDQIAHPGSVFRMQFCYVHDANGGNGVKSRAERNEIYYNWIEGSQYHELELIGPDPGGTPVAEDANEEHSDVVGNVLMKSATFPDHWIVRFGGDATGQTNARYRFVHNTVILAPGSSGVFRLFDGLASLEAHNNVIFQTGSGDPQIVREAEASWVGGTRRVAGENNWLVSGTGARDIPAEWMGTITGADPMFENASASDYRPATGSPLIDAAAASPAPYPAFGFPSPEALPLFLPPPRALIAVGSATPRPMAGAGLDIGAFEAGSGPPVMPPDAGPGGTDAGPGDTDAGACMPSCSGMICGDDGCGGSCGTCPGDDVCSVGRCATSCGVAAVPCRGTCVFTDSDDRHCGGCDMACGGESGCVDGRCRIDSAGGACICSASVDDSPAPPLLSLLLAVLFVLRRKRRCA